MTEPSDSVILRFIVRVFMLPFVLLFGLYIFTFGEEGPGGGFQGGAIIAAQRCGARERSVWILRMGI